MHPLQIPGLPQMWCATLNSAATLLPPAPTSRLGQRPGGSRSAIHPDRGAGTL